jgi:hypothetical protein
VKTGFQTGLQTPRQSTKDRTVAGGHSTKELASHIIFQSIPIYLFGVAPIV